MDSRTVKTRAGIVIEQNWNAKASVETRCTNNLVDALLDNPDVSVVGVRGTHLTNPELSLPDGLPVRRLPFPGKALAESWARSSRPSLDRWVDADIIHAPHYLLPTTKKPLIVTIHDTAFFRYPEWLTPNEVACFLRIFKRVIDEKLSVFVPSEATADDLAFRGVSERRIHVTPWGIDTEPAPTYVIEHVRQKYELPDEFVLFLGAPSPRKNLTMLAAAMERHREVPLLITGPDDGGAEGEIASIANARMLGHVPEGEIQAVIAAATVLAYPSHLEGFGLPVLEAMAQGTPVVATKGTAPADILGTAGLAVDTRSPNQIADAIGQLLESPTDRAAMGEVGKDRSVLFRWDVAAKRVASLYTMLS